MRCNFEMQQQPEFGGGGGGIRTPLCFSSSRKKVHPLHESMECCFCDLWLTIKNVCVCKEEGQKNIREFVLQGAGVAGWNDNRKQRVAFTSVFFCFGESVDRFSKPLQSQSVDHCLPGETNKSDPSLRPKDRTKRTRPMLHSNSRASRSRRTSPTRGHQSSRRPKGPFLPPSARHGGPSGASLHLYFPYVRPRLPPAAFEWWVEGGRVESIAWQPALSLSLVRSSSPPAPSPATTRRGTYYLLSFSRFVWPEPRCGQPLRPPPVD